MEIHYCKQWFRTRKVPTDVLSDAQARKASDARKLVTALLGSATHPYCFLEFSANRSVAVEFLDEQLRTYLDYSFQEERPDEFFVSMARKVEFDGPDDVPTRGDVFYFDVDGRLIIEHYMTEPVSKNSIILGRDWHHIDMTNNWEPFPQFGHYEGMATLNRHIPLFND